MGEYTRAINHPTFGKLSFIVDKVGGGTVGKAYTGDWNVYIERFGIGVFDATISTGRPAMHHDLIEIAVDFAHSQGRF